MSGNNQFTTFTALETFVNQLLTNAQQNRATLETKWISNYKCFTGDESRDDKTWKKSEKSESWRSTTFFDITRQKITAGVSLVSDILFKGGKVPFMLEPERRSRALMQTDPLVIEGAIEQNEDLIHRQFENCKAINELKRMLIYGATYGDMWVKSYTSEMVESWWDEPEVNILVKQTRRQRTKSFEARSPWDLWRDLETSDTQAMEYVFERRMMTVAQMRSFVNRGLPFIEKAIVEVISSATINTSGSPSQTPTNVNTMAPGLREIAFRNKPVEAVEGWVRVPRMDADQFELDNGITPVETSVNPSATQAVNPPTVDDQPSIDASNDQKNQDATGDAAMLPDQFSNKESDKIDVFVITVAGRIIAYQREPGPRPYYFTMWEENIDGVGGRSIADNLVDIQKTLNGAIRSFEDNTKLIANFIVAIKARLLNNKKINDAIKEGGVLELDEECENVSEAIQQVQFQDITGPLTKAIDMFMTFADLSSNLPRAEQGQQSENAQTAYELQQRLDKSGKYLASVVRNIDGVIKWVADENYEYNAGNQELDIQRIPAIIKPLGFTSFENRYLRVQRLIQMLTMALTNPSLERITKIKWLWEEIGKAQDLEADQFIKSVEELQGEAEQELQAQAAAQQAQGGPTDAQQAPPTPSPEEQAIAQATIAEKAAKAEKDKADADKKRTESAIMLGKAQNEAAKSQAMIESERRRITGLQLPG